jgi:hypothetical protein
MELKARDKASQESSVGFDNFKINFNNLRQAIRPKL